MTNAQQSIVNGIALAGNWLDDVVEDRPSGVVRLIDTAGELRAKVFPDGSVYRPI